MLRLIAGRRYDCSNKTRPVSRSGALLEGYVVSIGAANGYIDIYDGESSKDDHVMRITGLANTTASFVFPGGIACRKGLYVVHSAETIYSTIICNDAARLDSD